MSTTRRSALRGFSFAAMAAGLAVPTLAAPPGADAELIEVCTRFVGRELENWYKYTAADTDDDWDYVPDWESYHRIMATPATTPAGWHAKALAYSVWDRDAYDNHTETGDSCGAFVASLLRDMVGAERNAMMYRLAAKYGPLPPGYNAEGIFIGYTPEYLEQRRAQRLRDNPPVKAPPAEDPDEGWRTYDVSRMTREQLESQVHTHRELQKTLATMHGRVLDQFAANGWDVPAELTG